MWGSWNSDVVSNVNSIESVVEKDNDDKQNTVFDGKAAVPASACPGTPIKAFTSHKSRYFYNSRVQPSAVEAVLARQVFAGEKFDNYVRGWVFWVGASLVLAAAFLINV